MKGNNQIDSWADTNIHLLQLQSSMQRAITKIKAKGNLRERDVSR